MDKQRAIAGRYGRLLIPLCLAMTVPSVAAAQAGTRCAAERGLSSREGNTRTQLTFINEADYPIRIYWLNYQGQRVQYARLMPGQSHRRPTFASHPWVITDLANNCRQVVFAESRDQVFRFNAPAYEAPRDWNRYDDDAGWSDDRRGADDGRRYDPQDRDAPLTERDASRRVDVEVGRRLTIALPSNGSTGYHWDAVFLTNVSVLGDITEQRASDAMIGAGGTSIIRLRVTRPGPAEVTLMYVPPGGGRSRKTLTYRFNGY